MRFHYVFCFLTLLAGWLTSNAQSVRQHGLSRQLTFSTDNDFLLFTDRYYSFGMDIEYNSLVRPESRIHNYFSHGNDSSKIRFNYHYGNKIFTPNNITTRQTKFMDRPYAGWNFIKLGLTVFNRKNSGHDFGIETGLIGEISGMGQFQQWWHKSIGIYPINGWDSQIANEVVLNIFYSYSKSWKVTDKVDMVTVSRVIAGTGANRIGQEINFRFFKFNPISNSAFTNSRLSWNKKSRLSMPDNEAYLFAGISGEYVATNIFVEGSIFKNNPSVYTLTARHGLGSAKVGFTYSGQVLGYTMVFYHVGKEIRNNFKDNYISLMMYVRF